MYVYLLTTGVLYRNGKVTVMRFRKIQGLRQCGENIGFVVRFAGGILTVFEIQHPVKHTLLGLFHYSFSGV